MPAETAMPSEFGRYLAECRRERGWSQSVLANRSQLIQKQVSHFESGGRLPSLAQALNLARGLSVPLQRLLSGDDRPGSSVAELLIELSRLGIDDLAAGGPCRPRGRSTHRGGAGDRGLGAFTRSADRLGLAGRLGLEPHRACVAGCLRSSLRDDPSFGVAGRCRPHDRSGGRLPWWMTPRSSQRGSRTNAAGGDGGDENTAVG